MRNRIFPAIALASIFAVGTIQAQDQLGNLKLTKDLLVGNWRIVSIIDDGEQLGPELVARAVAKDRKVTISDRTITFEHPETHEVRKLAYRIDPANGVRKIDVISRDDKMMPGIYEFQGDSLKVIFDRSKDPVRPEDFTSTPGSRRFFVTLSLDKGPGATVVSQPRLRSDVIEDDHIGTPREGERSRVNLNRMSPEARRAHELLAGTWEIIAVTDDGQQLGPDLIRRRFAEDGKLKIGSHSWTRTSPTTGERWISTVDLDPTKTPSWIDVTSSFDEVHRGIYRFAGDKLLICLARSESDPRPTEFDAPAGSDLLLMTLRVAKSTPAARPVSQTLPRVDVNEYIDDDPIPAPKLEQPRPRPEPRPEPKPEPPPVRTISTDERVRELIVGSWSITDRRGSLTIVFRRDGTFVATRYWKKVVKRMFEGPDTNSSGRWSYGSGILDAQVLVTQDARIAGQIFYGNIQSIGDQTMVYRTGLGELMTAKRLR